MSVNLSLNRFVYLVGVTKGRSAEKAVVKMPEDQLAAKRVVQEWEAMGLRTEARVLSVQQMKNLLRRIGR